jgi:phosphatidylserine/phosphatidylglycerophosphate/cardiolipin synthase-like enzyme
VEPEFIFLHEGRQDASLVFERLLDFIGGARTSLDLAVYDVHLSNAWGTRLIEALDAAENRGVVVRAVYNDVERKGRAPSPPSGPSLLSLLAAAVPATAIPGVPDLMHHKYMIRDADTVWTGSANWTEDAWSRMENMVVIAPSADLAAAYALDFEQLWKKRKVLGSGAFDDQPASLQYRAAPFSVRAVFSPGRGRALGQLMARRIQRATTRVRICSPVITSGPVLSTLAEVLDDKQCDTRITIDGPQMDQAVEQWQRDGRAGWKVPLVKRIRASGCVHEKRSTPYGSGPPYSYMHAKVVVCDDVVLTGSYNVSHSGEMNAENVLEIHSSAAADECATFCETVHARYSA